MITVKQLQDTNVLMVQGIDHLVKSDYKLLVSKTDEAVARFGRISMPVELRKFKGWTMEALWEDLKFDIKHFNDIDRLAVVGEKKWGKGLAIFSKPFTKATVRYFDLSEFDAAKSWVCISL